MNQEQQNSQQQINEWFDKQKSTDRSFDLSIVIPAYNEQWRLPTTLIDIIDYINLKNLDAEIIVVDDGSTDLTCETVRKFERISSKVRLLRVPKNSGKGNAVRSGMLNAYGKLVLFTDADGSTPISEVSRLEQAINDGADVAIGSRALYSKDTTVSTLPHRKYLGRLFNLFVNLIVLPKIADTQCGFKMFSTRAAHFLFEKQQSTGFSFDVEILYIAQRAQMKVVEVPINWTNAPGSKVNLVLDSIRMLFDIVRTKFRHNSVTPEQWASYK